jgi:23S rRNA (guanine745-N1)-methyltransferase
LNHASLLACTVRGCGRPLERRARSFVCAGGHSYDVARNGYVNLLQPQDRRSLAAGDSKSAVEARSRLFAAGAGRAIVSEIVRRVATLDLLAGALVADLGCGSGDALAALAAETASTGVGIDLSTAAIQHAARRFPSLTWVVANADRRLPFLDHSVAFVMSVHGRRNASECARVLSPTGFLCVAVPARDDLIELRASVQGEGIERARGQALLAEHEPFFAMLEHFAVRERRTLDRTSLLDLLRGTYRGERTSTAARVGALTNLEVTLASDAFLFAPRPLGNL